MHKLFKSITYLTCIATFSAAAWAINDGTNYTLLDAAKNQVIISSSRSKIQNLLTEINSDHSRNANDRLYYITQQLLDSPYLFTGATGESDSQGAAHVKQDPIYQLNGFDCQTLVQMVMALMYSHNLNEFDQNILKIGYGAAGITANDVVHYYNRNNFPDGDWNPINERNGWLFDVTSQGILAPYTETSYATLTRQNWFILQQQNLSANVRVLADVNGPLMVKRFMTEYSALNYPNFDSQTVATTYLPKEKIALLQTDGSYVPNQELLDKMPTPSVIEIVRDPKKWNIGGKNIKDILGSELSISHMGLLYRHTYKNGEIIYRKITCNNDNHNVKVCSVIPVTCQNNFCSELMFAHATVSHPNNYYWYQLPNGDYTCSANLPSNNTHVTQCNRVETQPLFDYLTDFQNGSYVYMSSPSIVGVHLEQLAD